MKRKFTLLTIAILLTIIQIQKTNAQEDNTNTVGVLAVDIKIPTFDEITRQKTGDLELKKGDTVTILETDPDGIVIQKDNSIKIKEPINTITPESLTKTSVKEVKQKDKPMGNTDPKIAKDFPQPKTNGATNGSTSEVIKNDIENDIDTPLPVMYQNRDDSVRIVKAGTNYFMLYLGENPTKNGIWTKLDVKPIKVYPWGVTESNTLIINDKQIRGMHTCEIEKIQGEDVYVRFIDISIPNYPEPIKLKKNQLDYEALQSYCKATNNPPKESGLEIPSWGKEPGYSSPTKNPDLSDCKRSPYHINGWKPYIQYPKTFTKYNNAFGGDGDRPRYSIKWAGKLFGNGDAVLFPNNGMTISITSHNWDRTNSYANIASLFKQTREINQSSEEFIVNRNLYGASYIPMKPYEKILSLGPVINTTRCLANPAPFSTLALIPENKLVEWLIKKSEQGFTEGEIELKQVDWMNNQYITKNGRTFNDLLKGK